MARSSPRLPLCYGSCLSMLAVLQGRNYPPTGLLDDSLKQKDWTSGVHCITKNNV
jgi:hypothetical protein